MNVLLDSHIFVWLLQELHKVGADTREFLKQTNQAYVSLATIWELGLKHSKGQLLVGASDLLSACRDSGYELLPIAKEHVVAATTLKLGHKDPFDLMLLAQAQTDGLQFITADKPLLDLGFSFVIDARN